MLDKKRLDELKVILKEEFNMDLSDEEVSEIGNNLIDYFKALYDVYVNNYDEVHKLVRKKKLESKKIKKKNQRRK